MASELESHWIKDHWITLLAGVCTVFLLLIGILMLLGPDTGDEVSDRLIGAVFLVAGLAISAGLWGLRTGQLKLWVANILIVVGLIATGMFFWLLLIPTVVALIVVYSGVLRGGLQKELQTA